MSKKPKTPVPGWPKKTRLPLLAAFPILNGQHRDRAALVELLKSRTSRPASFDNCLNVAREVAGEWDQRVGFAEAAGVPVGSQRVAADRLAAVVDLDDEARSGLEALGGLDFDSAFAVFSGRANASDTVAEALRVKAAREAEAARLN